MRDGHSQDIHTKGGKEAGQLKDMKFRLKQDEGDKVTGDRVTVSAQEGGTNVSPASMQVAAKTLLPQ